MAFNGGLIPWTWGKRSLPIRKEDDRWSRYPSLPDINRLFEEFLTGFPMGTSVSEGGTFAFQPRVDLTETPTELKISAELPGMSDKDIDLTMSNDCLIITGEKKEEHEDRTHGYHRVERRYGSFRRAVQLPCEIEADKVEATFKNGVLMVTLPKSTKAQESQKRIVVKQG